MAGLDFYTAESYLERNENWIAALAIVFVTIVFAEIVDRNLSRRGLTERVVGGELSAEATTRIRLVRRLIFALIVVIGLAFAAFRFDPVRQVATGVLASSAVLGLVVGFAARATLANAIAGVMLAVTQPIRIGDLVTFEDKTGTVEDIKLTYTYIRLDDADRAIELIADPDEGVQATVAEVTQEGVRLNATTWSAHPDERGKIAAELRGRWLRLLREHDLSSGEGAEASPAGASPIHSP